MAKKPVAKAAQPPADDLHQAADVLIHDGKTVTPAPPGPTLHDTIERLEKRIQK